MSARAELRAQNPAELVDGALLAVRRGGGNALVRAWAGGGAIAAIAIAVFFFERVEGVRSLRPALALGLVLAFGLRALLLSGVARDYVRLLRPELPIAEPAPAAVDVLGVAAVAALGLYVWLWPLAGLVLLSPWAVAALWPLLALRGGVAPSWLARASCGRERGLPAFAQAFDDSGGARAASVVVEMLVLIGSVGLFGNLYALTSAAVLIAHSMFGLDVAFVSTFLSPDNGFVLLLVASAALVLLEPLRAGIAAQSFIEARARREGADLHAAVEAIVTPEAAGPMRPGGAGRAALLVLVCAMSAASAVRAQPAGEVAQAADAIGAREHAVDVLAREHIDEILARPEFRELHDATPRGLAQLVRAFFDWLDGLEDEQAAEPPPAVQLPAPPAWLLMGIALLALLLLGLHVARERQWSRAPRFERSPASDAQVAEVSEPVRLLDEAARLAARGEHGLALRALYLATLTALERTNVIERAEGKTNGDYLRSMPRGDTRKAFAAFTRLFDRVVYGHAEATHEDYARGRQLAERIVARETLEAVA